MSKASEFQGEVISLSSEGQGILRQDNRVVFVPFTAPGDKIRYRIIHQKKNFAQGQLLEILQPSSQRIQPFCRYFGRCGGCQLQHLTYEAQLESKQQIVKDALVRIGKVQNIDMLPVEPAQINWAYRRHITLKIRSTKNGVEVGYIAADHHSFLPVEHCPIFIPEDNSAIQEIQSLIKHFSSEKVVEGSAILFKTDDHQLILHLHFDQKVFFETEIIHRFLKTYSHWIGVKIFSGGKSWSWGVSESELSINQLRFFCSPEVFTQNHPEQSLKIYQQLCALIKQPKQSKIIDLYCGIGISTLLLAQKGYEVVGVEWNRQSIDYAQKNAKMNSLAAQFIQGDVEKVLVNQLKNVQASVIIINPPRTGLTHGVIQEILNRQPKEIVYISCMPSTLARDLKQLGHLYIISLVQPYDMFPQTSHVETLVHLIKK